MENKFISSKSEVDKFCKELDFVLTSKEFDLKRDLDILPKKKEESYDDPFTTQNTLLDLGFDLKDVKNELCKLTYKDYLETIIDNKNINLGNFYVFGRKIGKLVYIKVKIRDYINRKVFCVSFHYSRYPLKLFPYNN